MKRILFLNDIHCGGPGGLTPPSMWMDEDITEGVWQIVAQNQRALWKFYTDLLKELRPINIVVLDGDLIDGRGGRSNGTEQGTCNMAEQVKLAAKCIDVIQANEAIVVDGTNYHVAPEGEEWEHQVAKECKTPTTLAGGFLQLKVDGVVFNVKHKITRGGVPHTKTGPLGKERLWNTEMYAQGKELLADYIVRAHTHEGYICEAMGGNWIGVKLPGMQDYGSRYGTKEVAGSIDIGLFWVDVWENSEHEPGYVLAHLPNEAVPVIER